MAKILIKNGLVINRGKSDYLDVLIVDDKISRIAPQIDENVSREIDAEGHWVIPGIIDDQVHFRQPGLEYKAEIYTESRAGLVGGVTSFMEMPNTIPPAVSQERLEEKYELASSASISNYSFYMGTTNDNVDEILRTSPRDVCGIKIFMGSSTGNMLVDEPSTLERIFKEAHMLIATHCEDEETIRSNMSAVEDPSSLTPSDHPIIRSREGCLKSSQFAVDLANRYNTRLHVLHISTKEELALFSNELPLEEKNITSEACVHHLSFESSQYPLLGNKIKCNPAIKDEEDRQAIMEAVNRDIIDVIATDHAPHTLDEKNRPYHLAPSGLPLVQHSLNLMLSHYHQGVITKEHMIKKMCHDPAILFGVEGRGFVDEGCFADLAIVDPNMEHKITRKSLQYKCQWSPLEDRTFKGSVRHVFVNGVIKLFNSMIVNQSPGRRLLFNPRN